MQYLIVAVAYFTTWVEAEPLAKITAKNAMKFFKKFILTKFEVPEVVVTNIGM